MKIDGNTRVFITGGGGMLGQSVYKTFAEHCDVLATDIDLNEPWLEYADVRNLPETFRVAKAFSPDLIINLAALTDLEYCQMNPDETWLTNALGAENMALIAQELDVPHVYISTAGIFDGTQDVYNDFDTPNPLSVYAKAKYHGELAVQRMSRKHYIFRAGWMMGGGPQKDKKFINKIFKQISGGKKLIHVVDDKLGTPTYTVNFAQSILKIVQTDYFGLYNMVCGGNCSRYDVALEFVRLLGLENEVSIKIVNSDHFKVEYFAPRPPSEKLVNLKLEARGINYMKDWRVCLAEYAADFKVALKRGQETVTTEVKVVPV